MSKKRSILPPSFARKPKKTVPISLPSEEARVIEQLAEENNLSPTEFLRNSVVLYKLALDERRRRIEESAERLGGELEIEPRRSRVDIASRFDGLCESQPMPRSVENASAAGASAH